MKFTLSLDTELGVGQDKTLSIALHEREMVLKLLDLFEKYEVPATWAIVGHLFLSDCDGRDLPYRNCADPKWEKAIYAPDLIERIINSSMKHEIASHSFGHINYTNEPLEVVEKDIRMALSAMKDFNISPKSFVFPWNAFDTKSLKRLKEYGFIFTRTSFDFKDQTAPLTCIPSLVEIDESMPIRYVLKLVTLLKDENVTFHVWSHPANWKKLPKLEELLRKIKKEEVPVIPMKDGYDFDLPFKGFTYAHISSAKITYFPNHIGFRIYYANFTDADVAVKIDLFHRSLCKITKPIFNSSYYDNKRVRTGNGRLSLSRKCIGQGLLCYKISNFLSSCIQTFYPTCLKVYHLYKYGIR